MNRLHVNDTLPALVMFSPRVKLNTNTLDKLLVTNNNVEFSTLAFAGVVSALTNKLLSVTLAFNASRCVRLDLKEIRVLVRKAVRFEAKTRELVTLEEIMVEFSTRLLLTCEATTVALVGKMAE